MLQALGLIWDSGEWICYQKERGTTSDRQNVDHLIDQWRNYYATNLLRTFLRWVEIDFESTAAPALLGQLWKSGAVKQRAKATLTGEF